MGFPLEPSGGGKEDYGTPQELYDYFDHVFRFDLDAAAHAGNHKCERWLGPGSPLGEDALALPWHELGTRIFLNFPYSRGTNGLWVRRAYEESRWPNTLVFVLCYSRHETEWWRCAVPMSDTVFPLDPRVKFDGAKHTAQVPNSGVLFTPWSEGPPMYRPVTWTE